jgi:hypothetical protein
MIKKERKDLSDKTIELIKRFDKEFVRYFPKIRFRSTNHDGISSGHGVDGIYVSAYRNLFLL